MGDYSRSTFNPTKHYNGVLQQQGRVQVDADWNEQGAIVRHRAETEARDVIGLCGVPKGSGAFSIGIAPGGQDLTIMPGRIYVDGLLCELEATPVRISAVSGAPEQARVSRLSVDDRAFQPGQRVEVAAANKPQAKPCRIIALDPQNHTLTFDASIAEFFQPSAGAATLRRLTTYGTQPDLPNPDHMSSVASPPLSPPGGFAQLQLNDGAYLAFLDVWQRELTALDDVEIREVALGGPDTTTRLKVVWQLHLLRVTPGAGSPPGCDTSFSEWIGRTDASTGAMQARTAPPAVQPNECLLPPQAGFLRLENQLYRVEVHKGGPHSQARFKWSRENGSIVTLITKITGDKITVSDLGKDDVLGFAGGQWVEIVDEESTLKGEPHPLVQIDQIDPEAREITIKPPASPISPLNGRPGLKLLRWDQAGPAALADGLAMTPNWIDLEDGLQVRFAEGTYHPGDYWLVPARTATGAIEWPSYELPNADPVPLPQPPVGIRHHYCRLALFTVIGGSIDSNSLQDCRKPFPPLTAIAATDVSYDNAHCLPELASASTVQEALDVLCHNRQNSCTLVAVPGPGWEAIFDLIGNDQDAQVCFQVGSYPLQGPKEVNQKGNLKLVGCGPGTRIVAPTSEAALVFKGCKSVTVRDLYAEANRVGSSGAFEHLNGALTFEDCGAVSVRDVQFRCGAGASLRATCLTVRNAAARPRPASIQDCHFEIGHLQGGILLVNVTRAVVENNVLEVYALPASLSLENRLQDKDERANVRNALIYGAHPGVNVPAGRSTNVALQAGGQTIHFTTHNSLRHRWQGLLDANPPGALSSERALLAYVSHLADRMLLDAGFRRTDPRFRNWFDALKRQDRAVASQGITVGGSHGREVRLAGNTIGDALLGIKVALSHHAARNVHDRAGTVAITDNTVGILLPPTTGKRERFGIFAGNCNSLLVQNNNVRLDRLSDADRLRVEGIRIWGVLGDRLMVTQNYVASADGTPRNSFDTGIHVNPLANLRPATAQWMVMWNIAPSKETTVKAVHGAQKANNVPL